MPAIRQDEAILRLVKQVNDIWSALRRVTVNLPLFDIANENTPTQLTADQNNYVIGNYDLLRLSSSTSVSITGLSGGIKGRFLRIFNVGSYPITLAHQSVSSTASNRFKFSNGRDSVVPPGSNTIIYYDSTEERWIGGDVITAGPVFCNVQNAVAQAISVGAPTKIDPGTAISDQYGFYDDANNEINIQFDGFYTVIWQGTWDNPAPGNDGYIREFGILVYYAAGGNDNFAYSTIPQGANNPGMAQQCFGAGFLSAGDILRFYALQDDNLGADLDLNSVNIVLNRLSG